jgi:dTDP-4-dehydrorhamnose reductase
MKSILTLGDTGLLGQAIMKHGKQSGMLIRGASRRSSDISIDALDVEVLEQTIKEVNPQVLINAIALADINASESNPDMAYMLNAWLPGKLGDICQRYDIKFVHISTDQLYSGDGKIPHTETAKVTLVNEYAKSKYAGECIALTYPDALVIRTNIVGFRGWVGSSTFVEWLLRSLEKGEAVSLFTDYYTSSISTSQFSAALFNLLDKNPCGLINLASREGSSKYDFGVALAIHCGLPAKLCRPGVVKDMKGAQRAESIILDVSYAESILGSRLPDRDAVIRQLTMEYGQEFHYLER